MSLMLSTANENVGIITVTRGTRNDTEITEVHGSIRVELNRCAVGA
jgi:hypothetical protein